MRDLVEVLRQLVGQLRAIAGSLGSHDDCRAGLARLQREVDRIMTAQDDLNTRVSALEDGLSVIEQEIADLKAQPGAAALDFSGLDAVVARLQGDEPTAPPAEPTA